MGGVDIELIVVDLDGTLLTSRKTISRKTVDVIREARAGGGVRVVLATARPPRTSLPFYKRLGLDGPMINYNGALVWEPVSGQVLSHQPIPVNIARGIIKWSRERFPAMRVSAEIRDKWYTDFSDDIYQTETARLHKPNLVAPIEAWLREPLTKLLLLGKKEWLAEVAQAIGEDLPDEVTSVQTEGFLLQIMHAAVSKASAVRAVAKHMGVAQRRVMAIGDNVNDADMIAWAGVGVAMANGHFSSLRVADHITDHHDADGVASAISDIVLRGKTL